MLNHIAIKDFTIIDNLALDLRSGMTVLTGETGAGKSILIDALQYALGARADAGIIRQGAERADITVNFSLDHIPAAQTWLAENELQTDDECLLRRVINRDGRSKHFINGQLCTQSQVRELGEYLVNIHGQHENQTLVKSEHQQNLLDEFAQVDELTKSRNQRKALDKFAGHAALLQQVKDCYQNWHNIHQQIKHLKSGADSTARIELLAFQIQELEKLELQADEFAQLSQEHKQLASADSRLQDCQIALAKLYENEPDNACALLETAAQQLSAYQELDERIKATCQLITEASIQANEAASTLRHYVDHLEINPARLHAVEKRLSILHDTARKYKVQPDALLNHLNTLKQELHQLQHRDQELVNLEQKLEKDFQSYQAAAGLLTQSRIAAAKRFNDAVTKHIRELGMPEGLFEVRFEPHDKLTALGAEKIDFLVTANRGQPLKPLNKVASGGELSRISLAIQVITAQADNTPTLIFDEVDVGIGGGTAEIVGKLLRQLSKKAQVICITHLPQVAAQGTQHLRVSKEIKDNQTRSQLTELVAKDRIDEIARMLGGIKITAHTLAHAKEMLSLK